MATVPAVLGTARLGNFRLGYRSTALAAVRAARVTVTLAGALANARVRRAGFTVHDAINDEPNTCALTVDGTRPITGQDLRVSVNSDAPRLLFNGTLQTVDELYEGKPSQLAWACTAVDDLVRLNRSRPFGTWTEVSATTIAQSLITDFAPGFTSTHVAAALPAVSIIFDGSDTFAGALRRLANAIGGYFYVEDLDLHLFLTEATDPPAPIDSTPGRFLNDPPITLRSDDSQQRTRVYGKGHGEAVLSDVAAGEAILPVKDAAMFNPLGGQVIAGTTPDAAQSEILGYTGVQLGGAGSLVGPGAAPASGPVLALVAGSGVDSGVHGYAQVWVTAAGKSAPSPVSSITVGAITGVSDPPAVGTSGTNARNVVDYVDGTLTAGATYLHKLTYRRIADGKETLPSAATGAVVLSAGDNIIYFQKSLMAPVAPSGCIIVWYRSKNGGGYFECTAVDNASGFYVDNTADANVGQAIPTVNNTTGGNQVSYARIAGPSGTTSREYYRTVAGGSQLKLLATVGDNTTVTAATDSTADASLGANAPTGDTSGLQQPSGQVNAGSTSLLTASAAPFTAGWVLLNGGQVVRYTGVSGNVLTGIPASGPGAIAMTVIYGSQVTILPALTGVTGNTRPMLKGSTMHIWVERNDLAAQADRIALDAAQGRVSDGVIEHLISDMRRGEDSLMALCDADLVRFSQPILTVTFAARDTKLKSGKPIVFNLTSPAVAATLTLMSVDISEIDVAPSGLAPRFHCVASSVAVSLESILRQLLVKAV